MNTERVDKKWIDRGVESYSTEAILGTLGHYGVALTEAQYLELAKDHFPLAIAQQWHERWKGTGQFTKFPAAAAEELWSRLRPDDIAPTDLGLAMIKLLQDLEPALDGKKDEGTLETRFKVVENYIPRLPAEEKTRQRFLVETLAAIGEWADVFDGMPEALVKKNLPALGDRLVKIDEGIFPEHVGVASATLKAAKGEVEVAVAELTGIANDEKRIPFARLGACGSLLELKKIDAVTAALMKLLDLAESTRDVDLASESVEMLQHVLEAEPNRRDKTELRNRIEKMIETFNAGEAP